MKVQFLDARSGGPVSGLEVCAAEREDVPCAHTGDDGKVELALPAREEIMLSCVVRTHVPMYMTLVTPGEAFDVGVFRLLDSVVGNLFAAGGGGLQDPANGIVLVNVYDDLVNRTSRVAGATADLAPLAGVGPVFGGSNGLPDHSLSASTTGGPMAFFNVPPGPRKVVLTHPGKQCAGGFGWPGTTALELRTQVFPGGMSTVTFICPP